MRNSKKLSAQTAYKTTKEGTLVQVSAREEKQLKKTHVAVSLRGVEAGNKFAKAVSDLAAASKNK